MMPTYIGVPVSNGAVSHVVPSSQPLSQAAEGTHGQNITMEMASVATSIQTSLLDQGLPVGQTPDHPCALPPQPVPGLENQQRIAMPRGQPISTPWVDQQPIAMTEDVASMTRGGTQSSWTELDDVAWPSNLTVGHDYGTLLLPGGGTLQKACASTVIRGLLSQKDTYTFDTAAATILDLAQDPQRDIYTVSFPFTTIGGIQKEVKAASRETFPIPSSDDHGLHQRTPSTKPLDEIRREGDAHILAAQERDFIDITNRELRQMIGESDDESDAESTDDEQDPKRSTYERPSSCRCDQCCSDGPAFYFLD
ncbi:MAG: hypothetical protein M1816_004286 [Peltula sp. TS41687]|nr:MAG: hypothetical protein M1816_004286 [Peltula sp. TS41687]